MRITAKQAESIAFIASHMVDGSGSVDVYESVHGCVRTNTVYIAPNGILKHKLPALLKYLDASGQLG